MKKLISAFSGYHNISKEILDNISSLDYDKLVLPSSYNTIGMKIKNKLTENQYDKMIILGSLGYAKGVMIERFALNITKKNCKVVEVGNDGYISNYNLDKLHQFFKDNNIKTKITNYNGCGSCNYAYYYALHLNNTIYNSKMKTVFIHVPPKNEIIKQFLIENIDKIFEL